MIDFSITWLGGLYGTHMKTAITRNKDTRWNHEPSVLGASSLAAAFSQPSRLSSPHIPAGRATASCRCMSSGLDSS